jgi:hypothetical protein
MHMHMKASINIVEAKSIHDMKLNDMVVVVWSTRKHAWHKLHATVHACS